MIDLTPIHFSGDDDKLVRAIKQHPRLSALLPAGIQPFVTAYVTARATAAAVKQLKADTPDYATLLDADLKAGKQPDAAELVKKYSAAQRAAADTQAVADRLSALADSHRYQVIREAQAAAATFYKDLADQLDDILDRGAPLVAALDGINSADQALDAEREKDWRALKALAAELAEVRAAQMALIRAKDSSNFPPGSLNVVLAMFDGAEAAMPGPADLIAGGVEAFRRVDLGWPAADYRDPLHLLAVLRNRNVLQPAVARGEEVFDRRAALLAEATPEGQQREPGRLALEYGGNERAMDRSSVARQLRAAGPAKRAREAELRAQFGLPVGCPPSQQPPRRMPARQERNHRQQADDLGLWTEPTSSAYFYLAPGGR